MKVIVTTDADKLARMNQTVQNLHAQLYPDMFKPHNQLEVKAFFQSMLNQPEALFLLIEEETEPIGYAWIELRHSHENAFKKATSVLYVHQISIDLKYQKKGYGAKLMEKIYEIARHHSINRIELDYWLDNHAAADFYQKQGFQKYREVVYKNV